MSNSLSDVPTRRITRRLLLLAAVIALILTSGLIVVIGGHEQLIVDRSRVRLPAASASNTRPLWLDRLVFAQVDEWGEPHEISTMRADGSDRRLVVSGSPEWSAIGELVYSNPTHRLPREACRPGACRVAHISVIRPDGSGPTTITRGKVHDHKPAFSPDRSAVAFLRRFPLNSSRISLGLASRDGSNVRTFNPQRGSFYPGPPTWSPDGRWVAAMDWGRERILIVDVRRETFHSIGNGRLWGSLAWSPDGRFIAAVGQEGKGELNAGDDVYLIRVEGGRPRNITRMKRPRVDRRTFCNRSVFAGGGLLTHLTWSRDGKNLAMLSSYRHIPEGADAFDIVTFNVGSGTWETAFRSPRDRCTKDGFGKPFIRKPPRHVELLGWI